MNELSDYDEAIWYTKYTVDNRYYHIEIPCLPKLNYCMIYQLRKLGTDDIINTYKVSLIDNHYTIIRGKDKIIDKDINDIMNHKYIGTKMTELDSGLISVPYEYERLWDYLIYLVNNETGSDINSEFPGYKYMEEIK